MGQRTASGPARTTERERDLTSDPAPALAATRPRSPRAIPEAAHPLWKAGRLASGRRTRLADTEHDNGSRPKPQIRTLSAREPTASLPAVRHGQESRTNARTPAAPHGRRTAPVTAATRAIDFGNTRRSVGCSSLAALFSSSVCRSSSRLRKKRYVTLLDHLERVGDTT